MNKRIRKVNKITDNKFLNYFELDVTHKNGKDSRYFMASRTIEPSDMLLATGKVHTDGVAMYALYGEAHDKVVLIRQYRYPLGGYVYEFPAGLVEEGEDYHLSSIREMKEETGLDFTPIKVDPIYENAYFTTVGMTDECCATVYGYASGTPSKNFMEESEDIELVLADRAEVKRILKEEHVALLAAYQLMHFLHDEDPFAFLHP